MQVRKNASMVRLVRNSGIESWSRKMDDSTINLCPFFWMVVFSILLLPLRPFWNAESRLARLLSRWALFAGWVGIHFYNWQIVWSVVWEQAILRVSFEHLTYQPVGWFQSLFVYFVRFEFLLIMTPILVIIACLIWCLIMHLMWKCMDEYVSKMRRTIPEEIVESEDTTPTEDLSQQSSQSTSTLAVFFRTIGEYLALLKAFLAAKKQKMCPTLDLID